MSWLRYMARNHVAANLLMLFFLVGGALTATRGVKTEVFPEVELDRIMVSVPYPGASPQEVEQGIVLPLEEAVNGLDDIRRVMGFANESSGGLLIEVLDGADIDEVLSDIKSAVDRIVTFPQDAERPVVQKLSTRKEVMMVAVYGKLTPRQLRQQAEALRDGLLARPEITQAELLGVPNYEISIDVTEEQLRRYHLTLGAVAAKIRAASLDLPAGGLKTRSGEILLRTKAKRYTAREYENVVILSKPDGTVVPLRDLAKVNDTFEDVDLAAKYDGLPAALVQVFRVGDQSPSSVSKAVRSYLETARARLPASVKFGVWFDRSELLQARMDLLLRNAALGLILVIVVLGLFLDLKLAFWVTLGIPISVFGAFIIMPSTGVTINMLSLFAFILVLGIVVDDAIVVGENVYYYRHREANYLEASVKGAREVGLPVTFSVLTTVAAFGPLLFVSGIMGKFLWSIPVIVIAVLMVSLTESLFVLPAHLSGGKKGELPTAERPKRAKGPIARLQVQVDRGLRWFIHRPYLGSLKIAIKYRYVTLMLAVMSLVVTFALFAGGYIKMVFMPKIESDLVRARLVMPYGTPIEVTDAQIKRMIEAARATVAEYDGKMKNGKSILRNIASITGAGLGSGGPMKRGGNSGSHLGEVAVYLVDSGLRNVDSTTFAETWRKKVGEIPGAKELDYQSEVMNFGADLGIQLAHADFGVLEAAAAELKARLAQYPGLYDIADSFEAGKRELQLTLKPAARALGLTTTDLARQVRGAFYGAEALRLQRGRNEVKVMVRYPKNERRSLANIASLRIRTPRGGEIPFAQAATVVEGRGYARINRTDRKRTINVVSKADRKVANASEILADLRANFLPQLLADHPGLSYDLEGQQRERAESMRSMKWGLLAALGLIFALLAIPFRSYSQPLIIMTAIPFGIIGAVIGHALLGYHVSLMSIFGIVALTGVVVNDSLVLVDFVNRNRRPDRPIVEAVLLGCVRRFRPIMLTTLTTFFALVPMITETSVQAKFLVPMAISLAFGVLFSTAITLVLVPTLYVVLEDIKNHVRWFTGGKRVAVHHDDV